MIATRWSLTILGSVLYVLVTATLEAGTTDEPSAFFESRIRPVLVDRCYKCHSGHSKSIKGGLRVDSREGLLKGGDGGPALVPGHADESMIVKAMMYDGEVSEMPPDEKLAPAIIADFRRWIESGAFDPRREEPGNLKPQGVPVASSADFWAFQPPKSPKSPEVKNSGWSRDDVDRFILAALEAKGLEPAPDADPHTWLRRVSLDLIGLPPTPEQIAAYVADPSPFARHRVVDRLLASPTFGERWARHWLDLTGFADQIGTANDLFAEHAWRYRDYGIAAFNQDTPYDRFVREQIAGDLLPAASEQERARNLVATGFLVLGDLTVVEADKEKLRVDVVDQQVDKVGKAFLGMTLGCARCHDHKFDPISLRDYYGLAGIFSSTESVTRAEWGVWSWPALTKLPEAPAEAASRIARLSQCRQKIADLRAERDRGRKRIEEIVRRLQNKEAAQTSLSEEARSSLEKERRDLEARNGKLAAEIEHAEFFAPVEPAAFAVRDVPRPTNMRITIRGNAHALGAEVPRGFVRAILGTDQKSIPIPPGASGRRELAEWLVDGRNPLAARVAVNRTWQKLFGEGIVRSVDYFGERGERPTHPELLDALATRFVAGGWSQKQLIRDLVLSRTYAMSSAANARAESVDPDNRLLWRMNRRRLEAESLRDAMLAVAGTLVDQRGGPALPLEYLENSNGLAKGGVNPPSFRLARFRPQQEFVRTVYLPILRSAPQAGPAEVRNVFDFTQPGEISSQRPTTNVPTQALFLMNARFLKQRAGELARWTMSAAETEPDRLATLWLRTLNRPLTTAERDDASAFLKSVRELSGTKGQPATELSAWAELCHALLASNEFLMRL